ncbi:MAG: hypothetical protein N4A46_05180 [Schleiferiaceae bacterium]|nr:hypothetical protein [Schleiferiaceae bacterium]
MKYLASLLFITFLVSCSSNRTISESTADKNTEQKIKKSYGPGGKIIYGNSIRVAAGETIDEKGRSKKEAVEQISYHSKTTKAFRNKKQKRKKLEALANQLATDFSKLKIVKRKLPRIGTSKASSKNYNDVFEAKADKNAKLGFTFSLVGAISLAISFIALIIAFTTGGGEVAIVLFLFIGCIATIIGFIYSILGLKSPNKKGLAIAGTIISGIILFTAFISLLAALGTA